MIQILTKNSRIQLWKNYQKNKKKKKLDPNLKRDLKPGWLMPYLFEIESMFWGRWNYWEECQLIPSEIWKFWQMQTLITGKTETKYIPKYVIENTIPDREIPQIEWQQDKETENMLWKSLNLIPEYGEIKGFSSQIYLEYFLDWLLFALGHPAYLEEPKEPNNCKGASLRLYQFFDISYLLMYPYDYFGIIIPELTGKQAKQRTGFFPTPMPIAQLMGQIVNDKITTKQDRIKKVHEPCVGTGGLLLVQSNYNLCSIGIDINLRLLKASLVQFAFYTPWYYCPIWWLGNTDLILGNTLTLKSLESINNKYWLEKFRDIVKVEKVIEYREKELKLDLKDLIKKKKVEKVKVNPIVKASLKTKSKKQQFTQLSLFDLDT